jgi:hypothetical protein
MCAGHVVGVKLPIRVDKLFGKGKGIVKKVGGCTLIFCPVKRGYVTCPECTNCIGLCERAAFVRPWKKKRFLPQIDAAR